jgi:hypothetical protein
MMECLSIDVDLTLTLGCVFPTCLSTYFEEVLHFYVHIKVFEQI